MEEVRFSSEEKMHAAWPGRRERLTATTSIWLVLWSTPSFTGGRGSPCVDVPPSFAVRWTLIVKNRAPDGVSHCATSGFRLASQAAFVGSMRPGLKLYDRKGTYYDQASAYC